jgi:LysM repeat protein
MNRRGNTLRNLISGAVFAGVFLLTASMALARHNGAVHTPTPTRVITTVQSGDTLWKLARRYGDPEVYILDRIDELANENNLKADSVLQPGQRIAIPIHGEADYIRVQQKIRQL